MTDSDGIGQPSDRVAVVVVGVAERAVSRIKRAQMRSIELDAHGYMQMLWAMACSQHPRTPTHIGQGQNARPRDAKGPRILSDAGPSQ